jgi:hypothetical protein
MEMKKVRLEIVGLSYSQTQSGAYALVLGETAGSRRLPIIIGGFEAQAIAIELEKMTPTRPLTHDLFKAFSETFSIDVTEILIYNLVEGIFYAKLVCTVRFNCPIYTYEFILKSAGIVLDDDSLPSLENPIATVEEMTTSTEGEYQSKSSEELKNLLQTALDEEQYELASKIRDELNTRKQS